METIKVNFDEVRDHVNFIALSMKSIDYKPEVVVGIERGGAIPGVMLSHLLEVPYKSLEWSFRDSKKQDHHRLNQLMGLGKQICFVDDIVDSGETLNHLERFMNDNYPNFHNYRFASLYYNNAQPFTPHFFAVTIDRNEEKRWLDFCWELTK